MARAVVILGAGSSADFGVPILSGIFKDSYARSYLQARPELLATLNSVFWDPRGHGLESSERSLNIEQMLTILHDWRREQAVPGEAKPPDVERFRRGLLVLIQKAVFEGKSSRAKHLNPLIDTCRSKFEHTTWASFNWDCIFEASFWYSSGVPGGRVNPSLAIDVRNWRYQTPRHTYLKLHGGINWWLIDNRITYLQWTPGNAELQQKWQEFDANPEMKDRPDSRTKFLQVRCY